jgi:hypothetical protein
MNCPVNNDEPEYELQHLPERQRLLVKLVADIKSCKPPMVFGVHGDWGAGKTSFLQAVMYELTGDCPVKSNEKPAKEKKAKSEWKKAPLAVWFEAWRYQSEAAPIIALLHQLRTQLTTWIKAGEVVEKVGHTVWRNFMLAFDSIVLKVESETGIPGIKAGAQVAPFQMTKARDEVQKARLSTPLPSNQIREAMDGILEKLLPKNSRVVIFIDDLDRCAAMSMFSLLESIKIYLNLRHCVFVLGINRHELERGIASILPEPLKEDQRHIRAHEYIEKLCGNVLRLPYPGKTSQAQLLQRWLLLDSRFKENKLLAKVVCLATDTSALPQNPRRMKMWCNSILHLYSHRVQTSGIKMPNGDFQEPPCEEGPALTLAGCLYTFYPELYQAMVSDAESSFMSTLHDWCLAEKPMDLIIFKDLRRVFASAQLIAVLIDEENRVANGLPASSEAELLKRYYIRPDPDEEKNAEPAPPKPVPLLTDTASLQFFHPQRLVAQTELKVFEATIRPYLNLD